MLDFPTLKTENLSYGLWPLEIRLWSWSWNRRHEDWQMWRRRVVVHVVLVPNAISLAILGRSGTDFMEKPPCWVRTGEENKFVFLN